MFHLPDLERHPHSPAPVPSLLILAMAATVLLWIPERFAAANGREPRESAPGPYAQASSAPAGPQSMIELRRQLLEQSQFRLGVPRRGPGPGARPEPRASSHMAAGSLGWLVSGTIPGPLPGPAPWPTTGLASGTFTGPAPSSPTGLPIGPLTEGLSRLSSGPASGPILPERRRKPEGSADLRLSDLERALLREQLRERLRAPAGRENR